MSSDARSAESVSLTITAEAAVEAIANALCDQDHHLPQDDARDIALGVLDEIQHRSQKDQR